ncbi:unnamed protein product [Malus baccata var. baccata]
MEFQGNAQLVLVALKLHVADDTSPLEHVVNDARHLMCTIPHTKITYNRKEANKVAHRLTRL